MPKFPVSTFALAAATLLSVSGALAQQPGQLDELSACRLDPDRVVLRFTFEGGACQETGEATLEPAEGGIGNVVVPTEDVSEMCTMQIVQVEFAGVLDAPEEITSLDILVQNPDGAPQALGSTDVLPSGPECMEPEAVPAE